MERRRCRRCDGFTWHQWDARQQRVVCCTCGSKPAPEHGPKVYREE